MDDAAADGCSKQPGWRRVDVGDAIETDGPDDQSESPGPTFALDETIITNRHLQEHLKSLRWMHEQLKSRQNSTLRVRAQLMKDLEAVERAIWAHEKQCEGDEEAKK
ncbi:hypothetical protein CC2G_002186 [Coprinopsis cinerea AmutBmut pab1-1]|nr:hypothetical protein CC2G_002186 [Coprinopsis cinerea AmutBmut pab1-1]